MAAEGKPAVSVVWFKTTDLRTHDHEPLCAAHAAGLPVLHLFVLDPRWFRPTRLMGFPRTGPARARFQLQALKDLQQRLEAAGHKLCVRRDKTATVFEEMCAQFQVNGVYAGHEVCTEELRVERQVREVLERFDSGPLNLFWMYELHRYGELPADVQRKGASGFSGYRRCFTERCKVPAPMPRPDFKKTAPGVSWVKDEGLPANIAEIPGLSDSPTPDDNGQEDGQWTGGETAALARLEQYFFATDSIAFEFTGATNFPHDGHSCTADNSMTKLSPWLAHGCLSARHLFAELKRYEREKHKTDSTARLVHELYFRDFVRFSALIKGSKIFKLEGIYGRHPPGGWLQDKENTLERWRIGSTGFPFLDASMRELHTTGHCCHAGREIAGWFLVCDLGLDWRLGAEWFESALIDYEPASNWFNWAFTCVPRATGGNAIQEEAKPLLPPRSRLQTLEVIYWAAQSDPDATYIKQWVPELRELPGPLAREPWRAGGNDGVVAERDRRSPEEYPPPVARERERIGWARRTFPAGGSAVGVWLSCAPGGASASKKPLPVGDSGNGAVAEKKIDPEDGKEYTWKQLHDRYKKQYSQMEVEDYWKSVCKPIVIKVDPSDGKTYTLAELLTEYQKQYSRQDIIQYFNAECRSTTKAQRDRNASLEAVVRNDNAKYSWPSEYPLPMVPPASFFCIEDIADHSRRSQIRKVERSARLRGSAIASSSKQDQVQSSSNGHQQSDKQQQRGSKRWARK